MPDMRYEPTWDGGIGNGDIWLLETVAKRVLQFYAYNTPDMTTPTSLN